MFQPPPTQSALRWVLGYSKRKTDPIFEIPTVENHRIDVSHYFLRVFSIFAVTAAERPYTPLILVGRELKLGQFRQIGWCKNSGGGGAGAGGAGAAGGVQFY